VIQSFLKIRLNINFAFGFIPDMEKSLMISHFLLVDSLCTPGLCGKKQQVFKGVNMRAVIQRVSNGSVSISGKVVGKIGKGLVILLGVKNGDSETDAKFLADKCVNLRIFTDENGKFNLSVLDVGGELLAISQFTLYGDTRKGRRPSFTEAAPPELSEPLYEKFVEYLQESGLKVATGEFGAMMKVEINNDGPVTIISESKETK
jgi:D-aminoacyl-tRNA deacylase